MNNYESASISHTISVNAEDSRNNLGKDLQIPMPLNILPMNEGASVVVSGKF